MPLTSGAPMMPAPAELHRDLADAARWRDEVAREWSRLGGAADTGATDAGAWCLLAAVLQAVRDCLPLEAAASLGNQLPAPVRGVYYARWHPAADPCAPRCQAAFLAGIGARLTGRLLISMEEAERATMAVLRVVDRRITRRLAEDIRRSLPGDVRLLLPETSPGEAADGPRMIPRQQDGGRDDPGRAYMGAAAQEKGQAAAGMGLRT